MQGFQTKINKNLAHRHLFSEQNYDFTGIGMGVFQEKLIN